MDIQFLAAIPLFRGASPEKIQLLLSALDARCSRYTRGEVILAAGTHTNRLWVVLSGGVTIENHDVWGNRSILGHVAPGEVFAETYACLPLQPLLVSAAASEDAQLLSLDLSELFTRSCPHSDILLRNLLTITAGKNLALSRRIFYTSSKTIRGRLLSYLSDQATLQGSRTFTIPFDRQQLADYLGVDRSALSNELSKLRRKGVLTARKNRFSLLGGQADADVSLL